MTAVPGAVAEATTPSHAPHAPLTAQLLRRQVVRYAPGVLLPALASVAASAIFTRVFDSTAYGRFSLAWSVAMVAVLLGAQWLHQGVARFVPSAAPGQASGELKRAIAAAVLGIACVTLALAAAGVALVTTLFGTEWRSVALAAAAMVLANTAFGPLGAVVQSEMRAGRYSMYVVSTSLARLALSLALVFGVARDPAALLWAQGLALALALPFLWRDAGLPAPAVALRHWRDSMPTIRSLAAYGTPVVGFTVAGSLLDLGDRWILQYFHGADSVGIYSANYSLVMGTVGLVALPMLLATHPFLMRAWESGDREAAGRWLGRIVEWYVIAGAFVVGVVGFYSRDVASVLLGAEFRAGHRIIPVVLAGMIVWQLGAYSHKPLEFTSRTGTMFRVCVLVTVANLAGNLLVVPRFGYMGAAWTSLGAYVLYTVVITRIGRRVLPWRVRRDRLTGSLAVVALGLFATAAVRALVEPRLGYAAGLASSGLVALATAGAVLVRDALPMLRARAATP